MSGCTTEISGQKRKRSRITVNQKREIRKCLDDGCTTSDIMKTYNIGRSTVSCYIFLIKFFALHNVF